MFAEYDAVDLSGLEHETHRRVVADLATWQGRLRHGTKFARLFRWRAADYFYLVAEEGIYAQADVPAGWGLLVRKGENLVLERLPIWADPEAGSRRPLLEAIALAGTRVVNRHCGVPGGRDSASTDRRWVGSLVAAMNLLGIEIGGTKLQLVLGDGSGVVRQRRQLTVARGEGAAGIREQIGRAVPGLIRDGPVAAVGVGFGGPVDWQTGRICRSHQIEGWSEFELGSWLGDLAGAPVFVDNDANVAALGEARHGAGAGCEAVFYVTLGSGVGGGLVLGGSIYHGAAPGESEVGHLRLDRSGATVESRCSGWAVDARIRDLVGSAPHGSLARRVVADPGGEARHLGAAWREGDALAQRIVAETAEDLAFGLSHVVHLFHPHVIVLGGGLAGVGEPLRAAVEVALRRHTMEAFGPGLDVRLTALGADGVPVGALTLAAERLRRAEAHGSV